MFGVSDSEGGGRGETDGDAVPTTEAASVSMLKCGDALAPPP